MSTWRIRYRDAHRQWRSEPCTVRTKGEAKELAVDMERKHERARRGLEPLAPRDGGGSLGDLFRWWLKTYSQPRTSFVRDTYSVTKHFLGVGVACTVMLTIGLTAYGRGRENGRAVGENVAKRECAALVAASSWANTPDGQLAYAFARAGGLGEVARCAGRGMVSRDGWCMVLSERGKTIARWPMPPVGARSTGDSP